MPEILITKTTEAFERGDFQPLLAHLDENIVWKSAARDKAVFRFGGDFHGRAGVLEVTSLIARTASFHRLRAIELTRKGEVVWGLFDTMVSPVGDPHRTMQYETAIRFRIRDNRILEIQPFFDTARLGAFLAPKT